MPDPIRPEVQQAQRALIAQLRPEVVNSLRPEVLGAAGFQNGQLSPVEPNGEFYTPPTPDLSALPPSLRAEHERRLGLVQPHSTGHEILGDIWNLASSIPNAIASTFDAPIPAANTVQHDPSTGQDLLVPGPGADSLGQSAPQQGGPILALAAPYFATKQAVDETRKALSGDVDPDAIRRAYMNAALADLGTYEAGARGVKGLRALRAAAAGRVAAAVAPAPVAEPAPVPAPAAAPAAPVEEPSVAGAESSGGSPAPQPAPVVAPPDAEPAAPTPAQYQGPNMVGPATPPGAGASLPASTFRPEVMEGLRQKMAANGGHLQPDWLRDLSEAELASLDPERGAAPAFSESAAANDFLNKRLNALHEQLTSAVAQKDYFQARQVNDEISNLQSHPELAYPPPDVLNNVLENPGGAPLDPRTGQPTDTPGFAVARPAPFARPIATGEDPAAAIQAFLNQKPIQDELLQPDRYLSLSYDKNTGTGQVNITDLLRDEARARELGLARSQTAISQLGANGEYLGDLLLNPPEDRLASQGGFIRLPGAPTPPVGGVPPLTKSEATVLGTEQAPEFAAAHEVPRTTVPPPGSVTGAVPTPGANVNPYQILNIPRLGNLTPEQTAVAEEQTRQAAQALGYNPRDIQHFAGALAEAQALRPRWPELMQMAPERLTGVERLTLRLEAVEHMRREANLQHLLDLDPNNVALQRQLDQVHSTGQALVRQAVEAGTAQGRDLAFNRILAHFAPDPQTWYRRAETLTERPLRASEQLKINDFLARHDSDGLARYVAGLSRSAKWEKAATLMKTNFISSLATLTKIGIGSASNMLRNLAMRPVLVRGMDAILGAFNQGTRTYTGLGANMLDVMRDGAEESLRVMRGQSAVGPKGTAAQTLFNLAPVHFETPWLGDVANTYIKAVSATHGAAHGLFWGYAYTGALYRGARLLAESELRANPASVPDLAARARELAQNPSPGLQADAIRTANETTLLRSNIVSKAVGNMSNYFLTHGGLAGKAAYAGTQMAMPFARISTNLLSEGTQTSPAGWGWFLTDVKRFLEAEPGTPEKAFFQRRASERFGKAAIGTALFVYGMHKFAAGEATPATPRNTLEKRVWQLEGRPGNSVKGPDGRYRNIAALGVLGVPVALGINFAAALSDPTLTTSLDKGERFAQTGLQTLGQESIIRSLEDAGKLAGGQENFGVLAQQELASMATPNLVTGAARAMDPYVREPRTFGEMVATRVGLGGAAGVPVRTGLTGQPLRRTQSALDILGDPFYTLPRERDDAISASRPALEQAIEAEEAQSALRRLADRYSRLQLTPDAAISPAARHAKQLEILRQAARIQAALTR